MPAKRMISWSTLVIAMATAGAGLDALPTWMLLVAPGSEELRDDTSDDTDDADDDLAVSWAESRAECRSRRMRPEPLPEIWAVSQIAPANSPAASRLARANADGHAPPQPIPTLLCRLTC
ncbi:MAG: hypothetical protein JWN86_1844 [Planctomycetota bacterium]|nr:hypothetical protein [Planctomycetota bacterium]